MHSFRKVTVALSLTAHDAELLRYAALISRLGVSTDFDFVHVVTDGTRPAEGYDADDFVRRMEESVEAHFGPESPDYSQTCSIRDGVRVDELLQFVDERQSDLVLLGHRRIRSGRRSLAQRMAMIGPCSVWLVPEGAPCSISRILAPTDFSEHSADSLSVAAAIAKMQGIDECHALHVFFDQSTVRYDERVDEIRGREQAAFQEFLQPVNRYGVRIVPQFDESSNVAAAILRSAERNGSDLLVMSTRGRSRAASILLGSATAQTMIESPIPILAVKHYGAQLSLFQALRDHKLWNEPSMKMN